MKVTKILSEVRLVIADLEVHLGAELRSSPTLCAVVPGVDGADDQIVPLSAPDGRPILLSMGNAIALDEDGPLQA
jgi:pyruvate/oxaloacetate carboxyltransferase